MEKDIEQLQKELKDFKESSAKEVRELRESFTKEIRALNEILDVYKLAPRIMDVAIRARGDKTPYVDATYTLKCDVVLQIEWEGRRYNLPAFEL